MAEIKKDESVLKLIEKREQYEIEGKFDLDLKEDPPTKVLLPGDVDYLCKKLSSKIKTWFANRAAVKFYEGLIKNNKFIIKDVIGLDNFAALKSGAVLTCNHFSECDNYAVYRPLIKLLNKRPLYKVIREGNYTAMTGFFGMILHYCNTLPLSSDLGTLRNFMRAMDVILKRGDKVLIYPEQSMWYNYKKPRPLKNGAFRLAAKSKVPLLPCFITMKDSGFMGDDGFLIQDYYIHYLPAIYPKEEFTIEENTNYFMEENARLWKKTYEEFYNIPLTFNTGKEEDSNEGKETQEGKKSNLL